MNKTAAGFAEKLVSGSEHEIFLVKAFDFTGQNCWHFVKIPKNRAMQFSALIARAEVTDIAHYGIVLASGYGTTPPPAAYEQARQSVQG